MRPETTSPETIRAETTARPVQRWALIATWVAIAAPIPSILWRLAMLAGVETGFAETELFRTPEGALYVIGLCVVEVLVCVALRGLIRPWGERVPAWVPWISGRAIPRATAMVLGLVGTGLLVAILVPLLVSFVGAWSGLTDAWTPTDGMDAVQATVLFVLYAPFFAWPAPILIALIGYWRRRAPDATGARS